MPAFESRRVRTQPLTVTGASGGAPPARMSRTLKAALVHRPRVIMLAVTAKRCGKMLRLRPLSLAITDPPVYFFYT